MGAARRPPAKAPTNDRRSITEPPRPRTTIRQYYRCRVSPAPTSPQGLVSALDHACRWLRRQRGDYPRDADVWHLRCHWDAERLRDDIHAAFHDQPVEHDQQVEVDVAQLHGALFTMVT